MLEELKKWSISCLQTHALFFFPVHINNKQVIMPAETNISAWTYSVINLIYTD